MYVCIYVYVYIYIYIERERGRYILQRCCCIPSDCNMRIMPVASPFSGPRIGEGCKWTNSSCARAVRTREPRERPSVSCTSHLTRDARGSIIIIIVIIRSSSSSSSSSNYGRCASPSTPARSTRRRAPGGSSLTALLK